MRRWLCRFGWHGASARPGPILVGWAGRRQLPSVAIARQRKRAEAARQLAVDDHRGAGRNPPRRRRAPARRTRSGRRQACRCSRRRRTRSLRAAPDRPAAGRRRRPQAIRERWRRRRPGAGSPAVRLRRAPPAPARRTRPARQVIEISDGGAALSLPVGSTSGMPQNFELLIKGHPQIHRCRVVWMQRDTFGVEFQKTTR